VFVGGTGNKEDIFVMGFLGQELQVLVLACFDRLASFFQFPPFPSLTCLIFLLPS